MCKSYKNEKDTIFEELGVTELKEYAALYKELKIDNEDLQNNVKGLEEKVNTLEKGKT